MARALGVLVVCLLGCFAASCGKAESTGPKVLIPDSVLVSLLVDLHLYESALQTRGGSLDRLPTPGSASFLEDKYGFSQAVVRQELSNLLVQSDRGDTVMAQVVRRLRALQTSLPAPQTPTLGINDRLSDEAAAKLPTEPVRPKLPERRGSGAATSIERLQKFAKEAKKQKDPDAPGN
jgi:hypothetical protein